jgi:hypothetical protein
MKEDTPVEIFNRELERLVRGGEVINDDFSSENRRALEVAQNLAAIDFSSKCAFRQILRRHLMERALRFTNRNTSINYYNRIPDGRMLAGTLIAALLVFVSIFGLLAPQQASATPAYTTVAASSDLLVRPAVSLTVSVLHNQNFYPKPVPTPMAMSPVAFQSNNSTVSTPMRNNSQLGQQYPIITTTISK